MTGDTRSTDFPTTPGSFQPATVEGLLALHRCLSSDAFVAKDNSSFLACLLYLPGREGSDRSNGIAVDGDGNDRLIGSTSSVDFPITAGAFDTTCCTDGACNATDAFVTKFNAAGSALAYSTFLGGSGHDAGGAIVVDASGNAWVTGLTNSDDFPTTGDAFQTALRRGDTEGGTDAFVTQLNAAGATVLYSSYLGGSGSTPFSTTGDAGNGIAVDVNGNVFLTGFTNSTDFPTTLGAAQNFFAGGRGLFGSGWRCFCGQV